MARYNIAEYNIEVRVNWLFYFNNQESNWAINFLLVGEYKGPFLTKTIYLSITLSAQVAQILNQKGNNGFFPKKEWNFNFLLLCNTVKPQLVCSSRSIMHFFLGCWSIAGQTHSLVFLFFLMSFKVQLLGRFSGVAAWQCGQQLCCASLC